LLIGVADLGGATAAGAGAADAGLAAGFAGLATGLTVVVFVVSFFTTGTFPCAFAVTIPTKRAKLRKITNFFILISVKLFTQKFIPPVTK
jgi:hypothetical protein